jgi:DNA gyrase subunit B
MDDFDPSVIKLSLREFVLTRPKMFIGRAWDDIAIYKLIRWLSYYAVNREAANASAILKVVIEHENEVSIIDDGRGLPVERTQVGQSIIRPKIEHVLSTLFTTNPLPAYYEEWGFLNYLGYVVNAISERLEIETQYDGIWYGIICGRGNILEHLHPIDQVAARTKGTRLTFTPDPLVFPDFSFDFDRVVAEMNELKREFPIIEFVIEDKLTRRREMLPIQNDS